MSEEVQSKENRHVDSPSAISVVLNRGGNLGCRASHLEASSHMLPIVASSTTCLHHTHCYLHFPDDKSLMEEHLQGAGCL